jgi:CheY-like chemotaxis protein
MDIQLPGLSGLDLTRRLKEDGRTKAIPIIAITAYAMMGDDEKAFEAGCDGYIAKPINFQQFSRVVEDVLRSRGE